MWTVNINGTPEQVYGLVRDRRGIVLRDGILLLEGICDEHGGCEVQWPEVLPTKIQPMNLAPWRDEQLSAEDPELKKMFENYREMELARLAKEEAELLATTELDYASEFGVSSTEACQRLSMWKQSRLSAINQHREYLIDGFERHEPMNQVVRHQLTLDVYLRGNHEFIQKHFWQARQEPDSVEKIERARRHLSRRLEAMNPNLRMRTDSTQTRRLLDAIRYVAEYPPHTIYLSSATKVPHDTDSIALVAFYTAPASAPPQVASKKRRKTPRPRYDPEQDEKVLKRYESATAGPGGTTMEAFARDLSLSIGDLDRQLQRARGRRRRASAK